MKHFSTPVLNRCVPKPVQEVTEAILSNFYGLLNSWDVMEQILGDLYKTWKEILGFTVLSLGKSFKEQLAYIWLLIFFKCSHLFIHCINFALIGTSGFLYNYDIGINCQHRWHYFLVVHLFGYKA